jgi:hypothetical protein
MNMKFARATIWPKSSSCSSLGEPFPVRDPDADGESPGVRYRGGGGAGRRFRDRLALRLGPQLTNPPPSITFDVDAVVLAVTVLATGAAVASGLLPPGCPPAHHRRPRRRPG